jgi:PAN domain
MQFSSLRVLLCIALGSGLQVLLAAVAFGADPNCPKRPISNFSSEPGGLIENNHFGRFDAKGDIQACKRLCSERFTCRSFDFNKEGGQCWLSKETKKTKPEDWNDEPGDVWVYYERDVASILGPVDGHKAVFGHALPQNNRCTYYHIGRRECSDLCNGQAWCRSFDFDRKGNSCSLADKSRALDGIALVKNRSHIYYEKKGVQLIDPGRWRLADPTEFPDHRLVARFDSKGLVGRGTSDFEDLSPFDQSTKPSCFVDDPTKICDEVDARHFEEVKVHASDGDILQIRLRSSREADLLITAQPRLGFFETKGDRITFQRPTESALAIMEDVKRIGASKAYEGRLTYQVRSTGPLWISYARVEVAPNTPLAAHLEVELLRKN